MKIRKLKIKTVLPILLAVFLLGGVSSASAQVINPGEILNNPYFPPADKASYSPVRNILDSSLASSSINELFERYGASMVDYVTIKSRQWENDRISCVEDVQDFIAYVKRGRGDTPPEQWSKLLQPNFFQSRTGPWNDFDGDGLMNSDPTPAHVDANADGDFTDDFDDVYGFGVPNIYSPLVQKFGRNSDITSIMASLGIAGIDDDDDNDGIKDVDDPAPFFATFGDARLNGNTTDQQDIYRRIIYSADNQPSFNTQRNAANKDIDNDGVEDLPSPNNQIGDLNPFGNDFGVRYIDTDGTQLGNTLPGAANGSGMVVSATGPLVGYAWHTAISSWNSDQALRQIRSFTAQTAYETDEIRKILIDNCVRMADLQGIMGRLEFKELIADRVGREVASEKLKELNQTSIDYIANGRDTDGDGEGDAPLFPSNLKEEAERVRADETQKFNDEIPDSEAKNALAVNRAKTLVDELQETLTPTESSVLAANQLPITPTFANEGKRAGIFARVTSYLTAQAGSGGGGLTQLSDPATNAAYWQALIKVNNLGPDNPYASYLFIKNELSSRQDEAEQNLREEIIANNGFLSKKECLERTADGKGCKEEVNTWPGSTIMNAAGSVINSVFDWFSSSDETSDLTPEDQ